MEQIQRIKTMENSFDEATAAIYVLRQAIDGYMEKAVLLQQLSTYYTSEEWLVDYDADRAGQLPSDLKRGILSEDAIHNLLEENRELLAELAALCKANDK